ncbi:hypothetical protein ES332_D09G031700v1 [Gossypium tomentosum]|uniref:Uncharacterized protein n=1 Tax=Gossypium tomentosum TaxID=34277 RepID=A0A5D2JDT7_GOSTO|nr:hypothetical protein ES332_D09G031700v1 [Gossypium tomentosum]
MPSTVFLLEFLHSLPLCLNIPIENVLICDICSIPQWLYQDSVCLSPFIFLCNHLGLDLLNQTVSQKKSSTPMLIQLKNSC